MDLKGPEAGLDMLSFSLPEEFRGDPSEDEPSMPVPPQVYYDEKGPVPEPEDDEPENDVDWNRSPSPDRSAQSALETGSASSSFVEQRVQQWHSLGGAPGVPIPGTHRGLGFLASTPTPSQEDAGGESSRGGGESSQQDAGGESAHLAPQVHFTFTNSIETFRKQFKSYQNLSKTIEKL